jgi:hypothetical protein
MLNGIDGDGNPCHKVIGTSPLGKKHHTHSSYRASIIKKRPLRGNESFAQSTQKTQNKCVILYLDLKFTPALWWKKAIPWQSIFEDTNEKTDC